MPAWRSPPGTSKSCCNAARAARHRGPLAGNLAAFAPDAAQGVERLTAYKVPRRIECRTQLPKSPIGKIFRAQLRT